MTATGPDEIEWREPPPAGPTVNAGTDIWHWRLAPLLERPGEWAMVRRAVSVSAANGSASRLRHRKVSIPAGKWEFRSHDLEVFARYIGPE